MGNKTQRILIIEDEPGLTLILEKWLKNAGKETVMAYTGKAGLEILQEEIPDLVLLDLMLPDVGGVEVCRQMMEDSRTKDIPIIFMTACIGVETDKGDETMEVDGRYFRAFAKPLHKQKLLSEIRKAINRSIHGNEPLAP